MQQVTCCKYRVAITLENKEEDLAVSYHGPPFSIDKEDMVGWGLKVKDTMVKEMTEMVDGDWGFIQSKLFFKKVAQ